MNSAWFVTRNRSLIVVLALMAGCTTVLPKDRAEDAKYNLAWPAPPDAPRVKLLTILYSSQDVEGPVKKTFKDAILGIDPEKEIVKLTRPMDITTDSAGRIIVADNAVAGLHVFDQKLHKYLRFGASSDFVISGSLGVDVDAEDNVYASDLKSNSVVKMSKEGAYIKSIGPFMNPVGVAVDRRRGLLYVVDSKAHHVRVMDLDGNEKRIIGERGGGEGQFNFPTFCDVDPQGNLYVTDTGNWRVQAFNPDGESLGAFGSNGTLPGQFTRPKGLAVGPGGTILVADGAFSNIQMFDAEFQLLMPFGDGGRGPGQFNMPTGIHVDGTGKIYVADFGNGRLQIFQMLGDNPK